MGWETFDLAVEIIMDVSVVVFFAIAVAGTVAIFRQRRIERARWRRVTQHPATNVVAMPRRPYDWQQHGDAS